MTFTEWYLEKIKERKSNQKLFHETQKRMKLYFPNPKKIINEFLVSYYKKEESEESK